MYTQDLATGEQSDLSSVVPASVLFLPEICSTPGIDCVLSMTAGAEPLPPPPFPPGIGDLVQHLGFRYLTNLLIDYQVSTDGG